LTILTIDGWYEFQWDLEYLKKDAAVSTKRLQSLFQKYFIIKYNKELKRVVDG